MIHGIACRCSQKSLLVFNDLRKGFQEREIIKNTTDGNNSSVKLIHPWASRDDFVFMLGDKNVLRGTKVPLVPEKLNSKRNIDDSMPQQNKTRLVILNEYLVKLLPKYWNKKTWWKDGNRIGHWTMCGYPSGTHLFRSRERGQKQNRILLCWVTPRIEATKPQIHHRWMKAVSQNILILKLRQ